MSMGGTSSVMQSEKAGSKVSGMKGVDRKSA